LIGQHPEIRQHAMTELYAAITADPDTQPLIEVAAWALGEFQENPSDVPLLLTKLLTMPQTTVDAKCYLMTALAKLAVRFGGEEAAKATLAELANNNHLEVQQRGGELLRVLAKTALRDEILAPVEFDQADAAPDALPVSSQPIPQSQPVPQSQPRQDDLLGLLDLGPSQPAPAQQPSPGAAALLQAQMAAPAQAQPVQVQVQPPGAVEALRTPEYVIWFELQKNAMNPKQLAIRATIAGVGDVALNQFVVQFGVPAGWVIAVQPPTGNVLQPKGGRPIQQLLMLENRGMAPLVMLTQTSYMYGTQPIKETGKINPIFG
jgi:hypothetical protein